MPARVKNKMQRYSYDGCLPWQASLVKVIVASFVLGWFVGTIFEWIFYGRTLWEILVGQWASIATRFY